MYFVSEAIASRVVSIADAIEVIESMFREYGRGEAKVFPVVLGHGSDPGTLFSMKGGLMQTRKAVGLKVGSYWPANRANGLKAHASTTLLLDPGTGYPRALVEASYLTSLRTAASDAVAVRLLSRKNSRTVAIVGAGHQSWYELLAINEVRAIDRVLIANRSHPAAEAFARRIREELGTDATAADFESAVSASDIIVTVTAAREPLFKSEWVRPGAHISAMGADARGKQELDPALVASARLFADVVPQSITMGEYEAAFKAGLIDEGRITPIGAVLNGAAGRTTDDQITIFDSSGIALQDLAICSFVLEKALEQDLAISV